MNYRPPTGPLRPPVTNCSSLRPSGASTEEVLPEPPKSLVDSGSFRKSQDATFCSLASGLPVVQVCLQRPCPPKPPRGLETSHRGGPRVSPGVCGGAPMRCSQRTAQRQDLSVRVLGHLSGGGDRSPTPPTRAERPFRISRRPRRAGCPH